MSALREVAPTLAAAAAREVREQLLLCPAKRQHVALGAGRERWPRREGAVGAVGFPASRAAPSAALCPGGGCFLPLFGSFSCAVKSMGALKSLPGFHFSVLLWSQRGC